MRMSIIFGRHYPVRITDLLLIVLFTFLVGPTHAVSLEIGNPSFELPSPSPGGCGGGCDSLVSWDEFGDVSQDKRLNFSSQPPTDGDYVAKLWGHRGFLPESSLEAFLELPAGKLLSLTEGSVRGGSAITQQVYLTAGRALKFDYDFGIRGSEDSQDFAFFSIARQLSPGLFIDSQVFLLADINTGLIFPTGGLFSEFRESGYRGFRLPIPESGVYAIGFGVADVDDVSSALLIDNVREVPESASLTLLGLGLAAVGFGRRKKA